MAKMDPLRGPFLILSYVNHQLFDDQHAVIPSFVLFEAEEVGRRSSDVGKTPVAFLEAELAARYVIGLPPVTLS